jgi:hypothetical protein
MGHTTIKMTMDTYGHLMPDVYDRAVMVLEEIATDDFKNIKSEKVEIY